jgi:NAD(P)-dependent dehydrogenase (short-subunit alcohol dehydrogenase family)
MLHDIDVVINLSGYNSDGMLHKIEDWDKVDKTIDINLKGNINLTSASMRYMKDGCVILISSILGKKPVIGTSVYSATKAAIDNLVKTAALEGASKGVSVNSIQLGYFDGGLTYTIPEKIREHIRTTIPLKRWGKISELERTIEWLVECRYATGMNIPLDGGISFK